MSIEWTDEERAAVRAETYRIVTDTELTRLILRALAPFITAREKAAEQRGAERVVQAAQEGHDGNYYPAEDRWG